MGNEKSLNVSVGEGKEEWQDWLVNDEMDQELKLAQKQEFDQRKNLMMDSMKTLNQREKDILNARRLSEKTVTLEELSKKYKVSRERIRQIETKAFEKLQKIMNHHVGIVREEKELISGIQKISTVSVGIILISQPVFSFVWDVLLFNRIIAQMEIFGILIVLLAMIICIKSEDQVMNQSEIN